MMAEVEWSAELAMRLVEEYRQRPELWDSTNSLYRVQTAKYEAWADMARLFECDIADLRKKLNSIFASHRREKGKIRNGGRSTWFLYSHLSFLPGHLENNSRNSMDTNDEVFLGTGDDGQIPHQEAPRSVESSDNDVEDQTQEEQIIIKQEPMIETYCIEPPSPVVNTAPPKKKLERPKIPIHKFKLNRPLLKRKLIKEPESLDSRLLETLKLLRKSDLSRKKDECDSFGEYIAVSLRKHDERTRSMIKQAINNILFEQEMKKYSTGPYTVVLAGIDENPLVIGDNEEK